MAGCVPQYRILRGEEKSCGGTFTQGGGALNGIYGVGMSDVREDWDALLQDVRALVEVERGRGVTHVRAIPLPEGDGALNGQPETPSPIVFGVGSEAADLVVVCETPGHASDPQGDAFSGPAGEMLERMLENVIGLAKGEVYTMNIVKTHSPESRNGAQDETEPCGPLLRCPRCSGVAAATP